MKGKRSTALSITAVLLILAVSVAVAFFASCGESGTERESTEATGEVILDEPSEEETAESTSEAETETQPQTQASAESTRAPEPVTERNLYTIPDEPYYGKTLKPAVMDKDKWYLTFVNKNYVLPEDYVPQLSRELFGTYCQLDARCAPYYIEMYNAALKDGCKLTPFSGYRSIRTQKRNFENEMQMYLNRGCTFDEAYDKAATNILPPYTSEHNLGLAMDIVSINHNFDKSKEFAWLMEHGAEYGFILRYPADKTDITMVQYEPWHWRYVGKEAATEIMSKGITLEEYLGYA